MSEAKSHVRHTHASARTRQNIITDRAHNDSAKIFYEDRPTFVKPNIVSEIMFDNPNMTDFSTTESLNILKSVALAQHFMLALQHDTL
jgi:hypothetical protein